MNISRFFGATNREALRQVRLALGPDALIISNKRVNGGVEILATDPTTAAAMAAQSTRSTAPAATLNATRPSIAAAQGMEPRLHGVPPTQRPPATSAAMAMTPTPTAPLARTPLSPHQSTSASVEETALRTTPRSSDIRLPGQPGSDVLSAIDQMRGALENRIDELMWGNQLRRTPQAAALFPVLLAYGFSTALLRAMLQRLPATLSGKAALQWARDELAAHLPVIGSEDELWSLGRVIALVGPTGVGKTTTIAKLAARCVRRHGREKLVLITTDTYRIGADEQLKIYGQMMGVPVHVVQDAVSLQKVLSTLSADQIVLIDNVGISQRDRYIAEQAALLASAGRSVDRLLVLNAASHGDTLDEVARSYAHDGGSPLIGCIVTKLDEASRLGAALDTAIRHKLRIHYVSTGQKVPQDLLLPQAGDLIDRALSSAHPGNALYAPSEADFAALMAMANPGPATSSATDAHKRKRLLPGLLAVTARPGAVASSQDFDAAVNYIDDHESWAQAYDLWRRYTAPELDGRDLADAAEHLLRVARQQAANLQHQRMLVLHDKASIVSAGGRRGALQSAAMAGENGEVWTAVLQQLSFPDGWLSSTGAAAQQAPDAAAAIMHTVDWLERQGQAQSLVHLFDAGNAALMRALHQRAVSWLAHVPAGTRVMLPDGGTTAGALAKTLAYQPLEGLSAFNSLAGKRSDEIVVWAADAEVSIVTRGQPHLPLRFVSVRHVSRTDGTLVKALTGLFDGLGSVPTTQLAHWLMLKFESRQAARQAAQLWRLLPPRSESGSLQKKAMLAAQSGLAAWQLVQHASADAPRTVATSLIGKNTLAMSTAAGGLLKLFALKQMMED